MKKFKMTAFALASIAIIIIILFLNKSSREESIEKEGIENITVSTVKAVRENISGELSIVGTVQADNDVMAVSETQGKALAVKIKIGDRVSKNAVLVEVDDELKQAAYLTAKTAYEKAKRDLERMEELRKENNISDSDLEGARLGAASAEAQFIVARRQLDDSKIKSPISGVVADKYVDEGDMIAPGTAIANIVDISKLKIRLNLSERDVFLIKKGDAVKITADVYKNEKFSGKVESIGAKGDGAHNYPVEVTLANNSKNPLKAGMFVRVQFESLGSRQSLVIPRACLVGSAKEAQVYITDGDFAKKRNIIVGKEFGNMIEVISGLNEGESVVISGQDLLSDNAKIVLSENN
jgi:RND family efflux transporter MFP subunit